jgi:hypothetical protein
VPEGKAHERTTARLEHRAAVDGIDDAGDVRRTEEELRLIPTPNGVFLVS